MAVRLDYKSYFKDYNSFKSFDSYEQEIKSEVELNLNGRLIIGDKYKYLQDRRGPIGSPNNYNRNLDKKIFNIPLDAEIYPDQLNDFNEDREHYSEYSKNYLEKIKSEKEKREKSRDYRCKDIHGNIKYNKDGTVKMMGKTGRSFVNFSDNISNSKASKSIKFIVENFHTICVILAIIAASIAILFISIYLGGMISSLGHTPFVICGDDQISGDKVVNIPPTEEVEQMATPEYMAKAFIATTKNLGWKDNAIIGALSYILQEGGGMGTFTYEANWIINGPSGVKLDKTLNNKAWLDWLNSSNTKNAIIKAYNGKYYSQNFYAIGIGLLAESDVWRNDRKTTENATKMIQFCEEKGKPWQDPATQMEWIVQRFSQPGAFDTSDVDPTKDDRSADEWCRRVTAGIGMPAWSWTDNNQYMLDHTRHVPEAEKMYSEFTGIEIGSLGQQTKNLCKGADSVTTGGNATIADAAVSLAAGFGKENKIPWDKDGSDSKNLQDERLKLYKEKHIEVLGEGDVYFASCDRSAATAIRWSGADVDFPAGPTSTQYDYLSKSDKWQDMGNYGSAELKPGDVLITRGNGHIKIYVGSEAIQKRFPGKDGNMYAGSFHDYFPYVYKDDPSYDNRTYAVFRNIKSDKENGIKGSWEDGSNKK